MAKGFYIQKQSGTYAETLEAFGVANLLNEIFARNNQQGYKITIKDKEQSYWVETNIDITDNLIQNLSYFQVIKFIKKDANQEIPKGINDYLDYPKNNAIQKEYKERYNQIKKITPVEAKVQAKKILDQQKFSEFGGRIDAEYDVYREIQNNINYPNFLSLYSNFSDNRSTFQSLVKLICSKYSQHNFLLTKTKKTISNISSGFSDLIKPVQLYNPSQGKGNNKLKADGFDFSKATIQSDWISEAMKISGALTFMACQLIPMNKAGNKFDLKIYVPEFNEISLSDSKRIVFEFKKYLKSVSPLQLDILNSLNFTIKFIQHTPTYTGKVRKTIKGFHSVYQKDLGKNKAVANISFISTPDFVAYTNQTEGHDWIEILENQRNLISNIKEQGDAIQGLQDYRNFLGSIGASALGYFIDFSYWYAGYLMQQLTKGNRFIRTFKIEHLTKFYSYMDTKDLNLSRIIQNEGFQAVAKAIRKSTVTLQYTPKEQRKFEIRYGLAQQLQNKAKSKEDLATFIGEFISTYNTETARHVEKTNTKLRANVKDEELAKFYTLLDNNPPRLVGALLASYGFALNKKEVPENEVQEEETEEENQ